MALVQTRLGRPRSLRLRGIGAKPRPEPDYRRQRRRQDVGAGSGFPVGSGAVVSISGWRTIDSPWVRETVGCRPQWALAARTRAGSRLIVKQDRAPSLTATPGQLRGLAEAFPVQVIDAEIHKLVEGGSSRRRRWLDWAVFHVEHRFAQDWGDYTPALASEMRRCKRGRYHPLGHRAVPGSGEELTVSRSGSSTLCCTPTGRNMEATLLGLGVQLGFARGWPADASRWQPPCKTAGARDRERGITSRWRPSCRPHTANRPLCRAGRACPAANKSWPP